MCSIVLVVVQVAAGSTWTGERGAEEARQFREKIEAPDALGFRILLGDTAPFFCSIHPEIRLRPFSRVVCFIVYIKSRGSIPRCLACLASCVHLSDTTSESGLFAQYRFRVAEHVLSARYVENKESDGKGRKTGGIR